MKPTSWRKIIFKALFSGIFFWILLTHIDLGEITDRFRSLDLFFFTVSLLLLVVMIPSSCLKWKVLLDQQGRRMPFWFLLRVYLIGYFFSNIMPSNVGGDVVRIYYIGRHIGSQSQAAVSVFIERLSGSVFLLLLAILAPLMTPHLYLHPMVFLPAMGALGLLALFFWIWKVPNPLKLPDKITRSLIKLITGRIPSFRKASSNQKITAIERLYEKLFGKLSRFHTNLIAAVDYLSKNPQPLLRVLGLTAFFYLMTWINVYVSFKAFGYTPDFTEMSALIPAAMVVGMIPVTLLGNLGFTESIFVTYFSLVGIDPAATLAMALLLRFKYLLVGGIGFFAYITYRHKTAPMVVLEETKPRPH